MPHQSTTCLTKVLIGDSNEIYREGLQAMLCRRKGLQLVGTTGDGFELIQKANDLKPEIIVTDIKLDKIDGVTATRTIIQNNPHTGVIALTAINEEGTIFEMLKAGAKGYLIKNSSKEEIFEAVRTVSEDGNYYCNLPSEKILNLVCNKKPAVKKNIKLSELELEIIRLICKENCNKEIASALHQTLKTIETKRQKIQEKIGARNMVGIVVYAIRNNIFTL